MDGAGLDPLTRLSIAPLNTAPIESRLDMRTGVPYNINLQPNIHGISGSIMAESMLPGLSPSWQIAPARLDRTAAASSQYPTVAAANASLQGQETLGPFISSLKPSGSERFGAAATQYRNIHVPQARTDHLIWKD